MYTFLHLKAAVLAASALVFTAAVSAEAQITVTHLTTEYATDPLGIDVTVPRLAWQIETSRDATSQTAYEIRVASTPEALGKGSPLVWSSGVVRSARSNQVPYGGKPLASRQRVYWQVRVWDNDGQVSGWSKPAWWETGLLHPSNWTASWITSGFREDTLVSQPSPYFRRAFRLDKPVRSARLYATSLGLNDLFLNGEPVSDQVFAPGWTSYNKRLQYHTFDVTAELRQGDNAVGAILGDGWYRGHIGWEDYNRNRYGTRLGLLLQLEVTFQDGTTKTISSGPGWKVSRGPILSSDIYDGEFYDATRALRGWAGPGYDDRAWKPAVTLDHTKATLVAASSPPVRRVRQIRPVRLFTTPRGERVFDLGQNMVGWARLKVKGRRGDTIRLRFAEVLDKEGNFYTANLRKAKSTETYIVGGSGEEVYEPHFTFHGFRYVEVEGYPGPLTTDDITGIVVRSDLTQSGTFSCSNPLVNQLWHNILWSQQGNFLDVPTDCPQRDERLGWTGDAEVFSPTACYNYHSAAFFAKWLRDMAADQWSNGMIPDVIPDILNINHDPGLNGKPFWGGSTGWADADVIIPWNLYLYYGDTRVLSDQYTSMQGWVNYMRRRAGGDYLWTGDEHYGDWLAFSSDASDYPGAYTDKDLIATAYFARSTDLLSRIARVLGKTRDAQMYEALFKKIRQAFDKAYVTREGYLMSNTQTAYCLAIRFHLLDDSLASMAARHLARQVTHFGHITTGFLGTPLICPVLSETGNDSLAYMLLNRKQYPSWLYPVTRGATTIWERWDGIKPDSTFQTVGMNSFNHYAYGAIGRWLYGTVAGIRIDETHPGFKRMILAPHPGGGLDSARATYLSPYGEIRSGWRITGATMHYHIQVPPNSGAHVVLPLVGSGAVLADGKDIHQLAGIRNASAGKDSFSFDIGSGAHTFTYRMARQH
jgi:alpha-L-rhamnosidase